MKHVKWPSITSFHNVRQAIKNYAPLTCGNDKVIYKPKVKLHGSNSSITFSEGTWAPQSRSVILEEGQDNQGFATWARAHKDIFDKCGYLQGLTFFGEFVGPGVNKGCAVHQIENKSFVVFAALQETDESVPEEDRCIDLIVEPAVLEGLLAPLKGKLNNFYILPWYKDEIEVDWSLSADELKPTIDLLNEEIATVEKCDPWVKDTFDIEGLGEGLVYYPVSLDHLGRENFSNLGFKAKGEKHKTVKVKKPVQVDPEKVASIAAFVDLVLPEARLEQALEESCQGQLDIKNMGPFLKWVGQDVKKECQDELDVSNLTWKDVSKSLDKAAREWFRGKLSS